MTGALTSRRRVNPPLPLCPRLSRAGAPRLNLPACPQGVGEMLTPRGSVEFAEEDRDRSETSKAGLGLAAPGGSAAFGGLGVLGFNSSSSAPPRGAKGSVD